MNIIDNIPNKRATMTLIPKDRPVVEPEQGKRTIEYVEKKIIVPQILHSSFYRLCNITTPERYNLPSNDLEMKIQSANKEKDIFLRHAGDKPLSAVSGKFTELDVLTTSNELEKITNTAPLIRYFPKQERVQLVFPISNAFHQLYLFMDSGDFGVYGGSGKSAASYGLAWNNGEFSAMTMFLYEEMIKNQGRIIHVKGKMLPEKIKKIMETADRVDSSIEDSKQKMFTREEIEEYVSIYEHDLTERVSKPLLKSLRPEISAYDLSCRLTRLAPFNLPDSTRLKLEYLAGEVIICYNDLKQDLSNRASKTASIYSDRLKKFGIKD